MSLDHVNRRECLNLLKGSQDVYCNDYDRIMIQESGVLNYPGNDGIYTENSNLYNEVFLSFGEIFTQTKIKPKRLHILPSFYKQKYVSHEKENEKSLGKRKIDQNFRTECAKWISNFPSTVRLAVGVT